MTPILSHAIRALIGAGVLLILLFGERVHPLRRPTQPKPRRLLINLVVAGVGLGALSLTYGPVVFHALDWSERAQLGLLRWGPLPTWLAAACAFLLLDYTLWVWHLLNHRVRLLWRFHAAHHADLDLDASTALRFHFGELVLSVPYRALQVILIGVDLEVLLLWETVLLVSTEFHHSNIRLPRALDRMLRALVVTPRIHGIHHSIVPSEVNSNFGSIFTFWDRLHRTFVSAVSQSSITIGLSEPRDPGALSPWGTLLLPFQRRYRLEPPPWRRASTSANG